MRTLLFALLTLGLLAASITLTVHANTPISYSPAWTSRPTISSDTIDTLVGIEGFGRYIYVTGNYQDSSIRHEAIVVYKYNDTGGIESDIGLYNDNYDSESNDIAVNDNYVYIVGYLGGNAWIAALDPGLTSIEYQNGYQPSSISYSASYYGVCLDGDGNSYAIGYLEDKATSPYSYRVLLSKYDSSLNNIYNMTYSPTNSRTNLYLFGDNCVIGPGGYLYATAIGKVYDSNTQRYFPVLLYVLKINPGDGSIVKQVNIPLYNSTYGTTTAIDVPADIASDNNYLYVAFSFSDEVSSGETNAGASVMELDSSLNILWRYNVSTEYHERLQSIAVGQNGDFVAGGSTNNPYGTGLSSDYYNGFLLIFNSQHNLEKAILSGDTQKNYGTLIYDVGINSSGYIYWSGYAGDDDQYTAYYDITNNVTVNKPSSSTKSPVYDTGDYAIRVSGNTLERLGSVKIVVAKQVKGVGSVPQVALKQASLTSIKPVPGVFSTPGGGSTGIVVATSEQVSAPVSPPAPVPEGGFLVATGVAVALALSYLVWFKRMGSG